MPRSAIGTGLVAACLTLAARGSASETGFYDASGRVVPVERLATGGPGDLRAVRIHYPDRARPVQSLVGATAIVAMTPQAGSDAPTRRGLEARGARFVRPLMPSAGLWLVRATVAGEDGIDAARRLAGAPGVRHATPNLYLEVVAHADPYEPDDPRLPGQWYFDTLAMTQAWGLSKGSSDATIVIVDTGCDLDHPDLVAKMDPGRDVVDGDDDASYSAGESGAAHGTSCAGVAAAATNNGEGIAGACPECRLRCVRFLTDQPQPVSATVDAFQFAFEVGASVVSNSWGYVDPTPVHPAIADAIAVLFEQGRDGRGALVFFAAGNDDREIGADEIGAVPGVFNVGAINHFDESTAFTNFGASLDLVAPTGTLATDIAGVEGEDPGDYTASFGGTSSACPVAAGIGGLLVSAAPERTAAELYEVMIATARPAPYAAPDAAGHDPIYGFGIIDPVAALEALLGEPDGPPAPPPGDGGAATSDSGPANDGGCGCHTIGRPADGQAIQWFTGLQWFAGLLGVSFLGRRRRPPRSPGRG